MMVHTYLFGEIDVPEEEMIAFENGIPGFEHLRAFAYVRDAEESPFAHLQSVEDGNIAFIITNPFLFYPDYDFILPETVQEELRLRDQGDVEVWSIVTLGENVEDATLNLLAPIIVNKKTKQAKQALLQHPSYKTRHPLVQAAPQAAEEKG